VKGGIKRSGHSPLTPGVIHTYIPKRLQKGFFEIIQNGGDLALVLFTVSFISPVVLNRL
jgi:hypothetical protein